MRSFDDIGRFHGTDKATKTDNGIFAGNPGHGYLDHYQCMLADRAQGPMKLLEIGVQHGYSLKTWEECLPQAQIFGVDYKFHCEQKDFARAKLIDGDASKMDIVAKIAATAGTDFDMIIDDASHQSSEMRKLFDLYFDMVKPGGFYVIEDLACGYEPYYGGDEKGTGKSIVAMLKDLIDDIHHGRRQQVASFHLYKGIVFLQHA